MSTLKSLLNGRKSYVSQKTYECPETYIKMYCESCKTTSINERKDEEEDLILDEF